MDAKVEAVMFDVVAGLNQLPVSSYQLTFFPNPTSEKLFVLGNTLNSNGEFQFTICLAKN
jgi:hypothetical protein